MIKSASTIQSLLNIFGWWYKDHFVDEGNGDDVTDEGDDVDDDDVDDDDDEPACPSCQSSWPKWCQASPWVRRWVICFYELQQSGAQNEIVKMKF